MSVLTSESQRDTNAPWLAIPPSTAVTVEHPCLVKNVERAIDMLGGPADVVRNLKKSEDSAFGLSFRPQDPTSRTIISHNQPAHNVLLRIEVPKRTGRKRKRGTDEPFVEDVTPPEERKGVSHLLKSVSDNVEFYTVTAIHGISRTHVFRSMPDYVYSTATTKIVQDVRDKIMTTQYSDLKAFELPRTYGLQNTETVPPAVWSTESLPRNYVYRENPAVKVIGGLTAGERTVKSNWPTQKVYSYQTQWDTAHCPTEVMPGIPSLVTQSKNFQEGVSRIKELFEQRPIWTRRALINRLKTNVISIDSVRFAAAYVAYAVRSGPWRDAYVKLGVDPRKDPKYRFFQTVMLQLVPKENPSVRFGAPDGQQEVPDGGSRKLTGVREQFERTWALSTDTESHVFTGVDPVPPDGKVWQLCDILDPQLKSLIDIDTSHIRTVCETRYFGWYKNGTNAKIRVAMKAKVDALIDGRAIEQVNRDLVPFLELLPESVSEKSNSTNDMLELETRTEGYLDPKVYNRTQLEWAAHYRGFARTGAGKLPGMVTQGGKKKPARAPTIADFARMQEASILNNPESHRHATEWHENGTSPVPGLASAELRPEEIMQPMGEVLSYAASNQVMPSIEDYLDDTGDLDLDLDMDIKMEPRSEDEGDELKQSAQDQVIDVG